VSQDDQAADGRLPTTAQKCNRFKAAPPPKSIAPTLNATHAVKTVTPFQVQFRDVLNLAGSSDWSFPFALASPTAWLLVAMPAHILAIDTDEMDPLWALP